MKCLHGTPSLRQLVEVGFTGPPILQMRTGVFLEAGKLASGGGASGGRAGTGSWT